MAKKYIEKTQGTDNIVKARNIVVAAPYDVRGVVETYDDLFDKATYTFGELYIGMLVVTYDTQDVYVLTKLPGVRDSAEKWAQNIKWKKVNMTEINPEDNLEYYQEKLGIRVVSSVDELLAFDFEDPYAGMLALVVDMSSESESEDESGLYILLDTPNTTYSNWMKIEIGDNKGNAPVRVDKISEEDILGLFE